MEQVEQSRTKNGNRLSLIELRARMPFYLRVAAGVMLVATVLGIGVAFYRARSNGQFVLKGQPAELSTDVTGVINGYERREAEGDVMKYYIRADKATTFSDRHEELENVYLEAYDETGTKFDKITAARAIYVPEKDNLKLFKAYFSGKVNVETRDGLNVKSDKISYDRAEEIAESEELTEFSRENISGKSVGAIVRVKDKQVELVRDVEISAYADSQAETTGLTGSKIQSAKINAGHALVEQDAGRIVLDQGVFISVIPVANSGELTQPADIRADTAIALFTNKQLNKFDLNGSVDIESKPTGQSPKYLKTKAGHVIATLNKGLNRLELEQNVEIETAENGGNPTLIHSQYAVYEKPIDKFVLKNGVEISTTQNSQTTFVKAAEAEYLQGDGKIFLNGAAEITQGSDFVKGDALRADLYPDKKIRNAFATGNTYLKQSAPDRTTEVSANEMEAYFGENRQIEKGIARGNSTVSILPTQVEGYTKAGFFTPGTIQLLFRAAGQESVLSQVLTDGRTTITMNAPAGNPKAANKKLTANSVKTVLHPNGKDILKADAVGDAELYIEPLQPSRENNRTTVTAARFSCDFYEGNNPRTCVAATKTKAVLQPTVAVENHGTRTLYADRMTANFNRQTQDLDSFEAAGNAKIMELDRTGIASRMLYRADDQIARLRGGEPTVWDSRARAKATEIDWDTKNQKSFLRGKVGTTYYSQKQTNGATPFRKVNSPVFITAEQAQFDHEREIGVYSGNARAWQDNSFVRADTLVLQQKIKTMEGEGRVQSLLYNAKRREGDKVTNQPVFAAAGKMSYSDETRLLHYENNVDIRQGTDRITSGVADISLNESNEVVQSILQNNVVILQTGRRIAAVWAQYTSADETLILRGNPARIEDAEQGSSQGSQFTISMKDERITNQGTTKPGGSGRTRTVYKVKGKN